MKKALMMCLIGMMALASQGFARNIGPEASWTEINQSGLWADFPKIAFGSTFIPVSNVCVDGDMLIAESPFATCSRYEMDENGEICTEWKAGVVSAPRVYTYNYCRSDDGDGSCREWATATGSHALSYNVEVLENFGSDSVERVVFTKSFTIPSCK